MSEQSNSFQQLKYFEKDKNVILKIAQEKLANKSGLSLRTIQRVENGETIPSGETLKRISAALDVTPNQLFDWNVTKYS